MGVAYQRTAIVPDQMPVDGLNDSPQTATDIASVALGCRQAGRHDHKHMHLVLHNRAAKRTHQCQSVQLGNPEQLHHVRHGQSCSKRTDRYCELEDSTNVPARAARRMGVRGQIHCPEEAEKWFSGVIFSKKCRTPQVPGSSGLSTSISHSTQESTMLGLKAGIMN